MRFRTLAAAFAVACTALLLTVGASANLTGSTFEGNDGNLVVNGGAGAHDWVNAPNLSVGVDLPSGTGDNSFGQGAKENDINTTVVSGSIPNSKADLARFAVASEVIAGDTYQYLAWSRENQSGTVNFDFELNAAPQPNLTTPGAKVLNRTVNDLLINYAFQGGSNTPTLTKYHWSGSEWVNDGVISSTCSEGATNSAQVADTLASPSVNRPAQQFGEAAINLTCAGVIPKNSCEPFSSAYVKSRSSTSFNSEIKDFIAPVTISSNNCGSITIIKHTNPADLDKQFDYTVTGAGLSAFSLNDVGPGDDASNTKTFSGLAPGSRTVTETLPAAGSGFAFASLSCQNSGGNSSSVSARTATITVAGGGSTTCTYVNDQQLGAIKVSKTTKVPGQEGPQPQSGVNFTVGSETIATDANGEACFDGLSFGSHDVTETLPTGYHNDGPLTQSINVDTNASCDDATYVGETAAFSNTPLTDVTISVNAQVDGATASDVDCDNDDLDFATGANGDGNATATDLQPQVIQCTITIDP